MSVSVSMCQRAGIHPPWKTPLRDRCRIPACCKAFYKPVAIQTQNCPKKEAGKRLELSKKGVVVAGVGVRLLGGPRLLEVPGRGAWEQLAAGRSAGRNNNNFGPG